MKCISHEVHLHGWDFCSGEFDDPIRKTAANAIEQSLVSGTVTAEIWLALEHKEDADPLDIELEITLDEPGIEFSCNLAEILNSYSVSHLTSEQRSSIADALNNLADLVRP